MTPAGIASATQLAAAVAAVALARQVRNHRPLAFFLSGVTVANLALFLLLPFVVSLDERPLGGLARVLAHAYLALYFVYDFGLAAVALWLFSSNRFRGAGVAAVAGAWLATVLTCAVFYPALRGDALRPVYRGVHIGALAIVTMSIASWFMRRETVALAHLVFFLIVPVEIALLFVGPWRIGIFETWHLADVAYTMLYGALTVAQGWVLWQSKSSS